MDKAKTLDPAFRAAVEEMKHTAAPEKLATDVSKCLLNKKLKEVLLYSLDIEDILTLYCIA